MDIDMPNVEYRGKNSYRLTVVSENGTGSRNRERRTIKVPNEIIKSQRKLETHLTTELTKFKLEVDAGQYVKPDKTTFTEFVEREWKKNYADERLGGYTKHNYYGFINSHLTPEFGEKEISKIKTIHIVNFLTKLRDPESRKDKRKKPLATNTILNIYRVLKAIMGAAKQWKIIAVDPMEGVDPPTASKQERRELKKRKKAYTTLEANQVILALCEEPEHWRLYYLGVLMGGFRRGEILGVEWPQVDFTAGGLWIEKQITFDEEGEIVESEVKTEDSEAFVPMPLWYMNELQAYKERWEAEKALLDEGGRWVGGKKQYLFHGGFGKPLYPDAPTLRWGRFRKKLNLPQLRLHDLRHTTAMLLREADVDLKTIQELLRHARLETTSAFYTHKSEKVSRRAADQLEKFNPAVLGEGRGKPDA